MALPDKDHNLKVDSEIQASSRPPLWSKVLTTGKASFLRPDTTRIDPTTGFTIIKSLCYRPGRSPGCILFDVTTRPESQTEFMTILATQFPKLWGVAFHHENKKRKIIEVNFLEASDRSAALQEGMVFVNTNEKIRILPIPALRPDSVVIRLSLDRLPFLPEMELGIGLRNSLRPYGKILDVGLSYEQTHQLFVGTGYAVLDVYQHPDISLEDKFIALKHNISWKSDEDTDSDEANGFHATWHNMPVWCTYCHDDSGDHNARSCPERPGHQQVVCWECLQPGYYRSACTRKKPKKGTVAANLNHSRPTPSSQASKSKPNSRSQATKPPPKSSPATDDDTIMVQDNPVNPTPPLPPIDNDTVMQAPPDPPPPSDPPVIFGPPRPPHLLSPPPYPDFYRVSGENSVAKVRKAVLDSSPS